MSFAPDPSPGAGRTRLRRHHRSALRLSSLSSTATTIRRSLELATFAMVAAPDPRPPALILTSRVSPWAVVLHGLDYAITCYLDNSEQQF